MNVNTLEPAGLPAALALDDVRQVVQEVFSALLGLYVGDDQGDGEALGPRLNACVQITGAWQGAIVIETSPRLAARASSIVFEVPVDRVLSADVNDALAELVNMIGGNIKTLLPGPSVLSLPAVTEGRDFLLTLPGAKLMTRVRFVCESEPLELLICEKSADAPARKRPAAREDAG